MKQESLGEEKLLSALQGSRLQQNKALEELCNSSKINGSIINFIKQYNLGQELANDILQDALIILMRSIRNGKFQQRSQISTFLIGIAKRLCQQKFRESQKTVYKETEKLGILESQGSYEDELIQTEREKQYAAVKRTIFGQLSEKCRRILLMVANGYSRAEVAEEMEWTNVQTAKNSVPQCRKRLRKLIESNPATKNIIRELL